MASHPAQAAPHPLAVPSHRVFLLRKLHSLTGVVPVAGFVIFHLWTNAKALSGEKPFDTAVAEINAMPYLPFLEAGILLPLLFHAVLGVKLAFEARPNVARYGYGRNWLYVMQRVTGILAFAFLAYHLWEFWFQKQTGRMEPASFYPTLAAHLSSTTAGVPLVAILYLVGIAATAFHLANGLWGFAASWGITQSRRAQRLSAWVFGALGAIVFFLGANTTLYFATGSRFFARAPSGEAGLRAPLSTRSFDMAKKLSTRSESGKVRRVIVVGGGLAGLMTVIKLCEAGVPVDLFSLVPVKRSHSVCAQGGINASINTKGEGDSPQIHLEETAYGGDFLANQPPIKGMAEAAPGIVFMLDRMGVPFNRTPEGLLDFRRFGGTLFHRTAFAGATTGQQLLYALDEQVRRFETVDVSDDHGIDIPGERMVRKYELWDFLSLVRDDDGTVVGIVAQDLKSMEIRAFRGDAVCIATGGPGVVFGRSTNSILCTGTAASAVYQQGACYANGEFIQVHPTAIPGADKLRLISESARGEGGRIWVPKDKNDTRDPKSIPERERDYFLERMYPGYGNLVPRDIASRAIFKVCFHEGRGIYNVKTARNENEVYLDLTHKSEEFLRKKLAGVLEIYEKFVGVNPYVNPMKVFPAVHYSMGGLWVDFEKDARGSLKVGSPRNHATNLPGLYAVGEVDYQYHGANRLGANSLLSCIYGGIVTGPAIASYRQSLARSAFDVDESIFEHATKREIDRYEEIVKRNDGAKDGENPFVLHRELGETMLRDCTIERDNAVLAKVIAKIDEIDARVKKVKSLDHHRRMNQSAQFVRHLENMLVLARVIAEGAKRRDESRGAHYKPAFPKRDDANWLKTTLALHPGRGAVRYVTEFDYVCAGQSVHVTDAVDVSLVKPRERKYEQAGAASAVAQRAPAKDASDPVQDGAKTAEAS